MCAGAAASVVGSTGRSAPPSSRLPGLLGVRLCQLASFPAYCRREEDAEAKIAEGRVGMQQSAGNEGNKCFHSRANLSSSFLLSLPGSSRLCTTWLTWPVSATVSLVPVA